VRGSLHPTMMPIITAMKLRSSLNNPSLRGQFDLPKPGREILSEDHW